ncbi:LamG-like jellyroll fold domain-containing protein [Candidatus Omnitrophota bacterium]
MTRTHTMIPMLLFVIIASSLCGMQEAEAQAPLLYYQSFNTFDFLKDDAVEQTGKKTKEERKLTIVKGRFGNALHLGNKTEFEDKHNMTFMDLDLVSTFRGLAQTNENWCEPFFWGSDKLQPMCGTVAFWIQGSLEQDTELFFQSANAFGRIEKYLLGVKINNEGHLTGYLVDARYDRHEVVSDHPIKSERWNHVVFTWDFTTGLELFLNGSKTVSTNGADSWWITQVPGLFYLPAGKHAYDELYIFDRPLAEHEVTELYRSNNPPKNTSAEKDDSERTISLLKKKSGISTGLNLPIMMPFNGESTLVFEEIWTDEVTDGFIPGWWVMDGRYENAWPHPYSMFTLVLGDADYHAEKVDIKTPPGKTVNYISVEGNLDGVKVHALEDEEGINTETLLEVPKGHGFFFSSMIKPVMDRHLRIPFVKGWGTPEGYKGNVNLPLTGETRLHEVGLFFIREGKQRSGNFLYLTNPKAILDDRYKLAEKMFILKRDAGAIATSEEKPADKGRFIDTGAFRRLTVISEPWPEKGGIASLGLELFIRTQTSEDVVLIRLRDPSVPSRIWTHAEVKVSGFDNDLPSRFCLTLDMVDIALAQGDRLWLDICSVNGTEILTGDRSKPSRLIVEEIPIGEAIAQYSPKEIIPAHIEYTKMYEATPLRTMNINADYRKPVAFGGTFDMVYPVQAVLNVDPDFNVAQYLGNLADGSFNSSGAPVDVSTFKLMEFDGPENAPKWAIYQHAYNVKRHDVGKWYAARQNPDGQIGGGWNDDTMFFMNDPFDVVMDSNEPARKMSLNISEKFRKTRMYENGYLDLYPLDRHHVRDFVRLKNRVVILRLGEVRPFEDALRVGWHHNRPDRTPINYAQGIPFKNSFRTVQWYWGTHVPKEPFISENEETITRKLKLWASVLNTDTVYWYLTEGMTHTDNRDMYGSREFYALLFGGNWERIDDPLIEIAVTWPEGGGPDIARWIEYADDIRLKARIYSFDTDERTLTARLYRFRKGNYSVICAHDNNNDGIPDDNSEVRIMEIRRFSDIDVKVPPKTPMVLDIRQIEPFDDSGPFPDLAIDPDDIRVERDFVAVTVHNIGNASAGDINVTLLVGDRPIETKVIDRIDAPTDYVPKSYTLYFDVFTGGKKVEAIVDSDKSVEEILERNNRAVAADYRNVGYFTW